MNAGTYMLPLVAVLAVLFILWAFWGGNGSTTDNSVTNSSPAPATPVTPPAPLPPPLVVDQTPVLPPYLCEGTSEVSDLVSLPSPVPVPPPVPVVASPVKRRRGRFISKGERECCEIMERLYGVPFKTIRPDWLRNPETGEKLELDCYNEELRMAVEYNGIQHYQWPNFTNQTYKQFENQARRDRYKADRCDQLGIYLITVPYHIPLKKIQDFIVARLPETRQQQGLTSLEER